MSTPKRVTDTASLHGLRTIFNFSVVAFHTLVFTGMALDNPASTRSLITGSIPAHILSILATCGNISVDVFLLISGFLLKSSFSTKQPTLSTSIRYTLFRYLRLAPAYLIIAFLLRQAGNTACITLSEFFLLSFVPSTKLCVPVGWSTNLDFLSHILLLPLLSHPSLLGLVIILTPPLRMFTWLQNGKPVFANPPVITDVLLSEKEFDIAENVLALPRGNFSLSDASIVERQETLYLQNVLYFGTQYRIASVVIGILLYSCMQKKNGVYKTVRAYPTMSVLWAVTIFMFYHIVEQRFFTPSWALSVHYSAGRVLVTIATALVIVQTCTIEDHPLRHGISRLLRKLLSNGVFRFLHKFSYVMYLSHNVTAPVLAMLPPVFVKERLTPGWLLVLAFKWYLATILLTLPIWGLERMALKWRKRLLRRFSGRNEAEDDYHQHDVDRRKKIS